MMSVSVEISLGCQRLLRASVEHSPGMHWQVFRPLNCPRCWYLASLNYGFLSVLLAGWPSKGSRYDSNYEADQTVSISA